MPKMTEPERLEKMYVKNDSLSTRIGLHDKYSVNHYGFGNWIFNQYAFRDGMKILELGCGTAGIWSNRGDRLPRDAQIVLSDFSPLMVQKAKDLLQDNPIFSFQQIDIQDIPYGDDTFDIVIANHMLYHVPDKDKALSEVRRVLKSDGCFYSSTLGDMSLKEMNDIYRKLEGKASFSYTKNISFTLENGADLLSQYFSNIEQRQYIDSLEVTDIDDLIAYIKSYNDVPDSVSDELYRLVSEGFIDGVFKIRKEQGIFICTK